MKKITLLISCLFLSVFCVAESTSKDTVIKSFSDIGDIAIKYYHPNVDSVKNSCWEGCVFIRFNINKDNHFVNIAYTVSTPIFIKNAIENAFKVMNEKGVNIERLKNMSGQNYILPLIVVNKDGCGFKTGWEGKNVKSDEKTEIIFERRQIYFDQFANSIGNMTNFSGRKQEFVDNCILLKPVNTPVIIY